VDLWPSFFILKKKKKKQKNKTESANAPSRMLFERRNYNFAQLSAAASLAVSL
jgi:hypothetical protein